MHHCRPARSPPRPAVDLGRKFLAGLGVSGSTAGASTGQVNRVNGPQAIEYVIRRAGSQMGVPYSWGGGSLHRTQPRGRRRRRHRGVRLLWFDALRLRGRRRAASPLVGGSVHRGPPHSHPRKPNAVTCCSGDPAAASTGSVSRRRADAGSTTKRCTREDLAGAHRWDDALRDPNYRDLSQLVRPRGLTVSIRFGSMSRWPRAVWR